MNGWVLVMWFMAIVLVAMAFRNTNERFNDVSGRIDAVQTAIATTPEAKP